MILSGCVSATDTCTDAFTAVRVRLYKEDVDSSSDAKDVEVPVMRECKTDETMTDVGTSDGSKFEIIFCED